MADGISSSCSSPCTPPLVNFGGPVEHTPHVFIIFAGAGWSTSDPVYLAITAVFGPTSASGISGLSGTSYNNILTQFYDSAGPVTNTVYVHEWIDNNPQSSDAWPQPTSWDGLNASCPVACDSENREILRALSCDSVSCAGYDPQPPGWQYSAPQETQYMIIPYKGATFISSSPGSSWCGYHGYDEENTGAGYVFSMVPDVDGITNCLPSVPTNLPNDNVTLATHEYAETVTDPEPGSNWAWLTNDHGSNLQDDNEIGDICAWEEAPMFGYVVSNLWDNNAGSSGPVQGITPSYCTSYSWPRWSPLASASPTATVTNASPGSATISLPGESTPIDEVSPSFPLLDTVVPVAAPNYFTVGAFDSSGELASIHARPQVSTSSDGSVIYALPSTVFPNLPYGDHVYFAVEVSNIHGTTGDDPNYPQQWSAFSATVAIPYPPLPFLSPASTSITAGGSQAYIVTGLQADNITVGDVTSQSTFVITPNGSCTSASCTAQASGVHAITATYSGKTATAVLNVAAGLLSSITVSPAVASLVQSAPQVYSAAGFDSYGNSLGDVTAATTFSIAPDGSCAGASCAASVAGTHTVTGNDGGITGSASLTVIDYRSALLGAAVAGAAQGAYATSVATNPYYDDAAIQSAVDAALLGYSLPSSTLQNPGATCPTPSDGNPYHNPPYATVAYPTANHVNLYICYHNTPGLDFATAPGNQGGFDVNVILTYSSSGAVHYVANSHYIVYLTSLTLTPSSASVAHSVAKSYTLTGHMGNGAPTSTPMGEATLTISPDGSCSVYAGTCTPSAPGVHTVTATLSGRIARATLTAT